MRLLFINHSFPGFFGPLVGTFAAMPDMEILFASGNARPRASIEGVRHIFLGANRSRGRSPMQDFGNIVREGRASVEVFTRMAEEGTVPDMIVSSMVGGYALFAHDAFPDTFLVGMGEEAGQAYDPAHMDQDTMFARLAQVRQAIHAHLYVSLTDGRESWLADRLKNSALFPVPVDTSFFSPSRVEAVTFENDELRGDNMNVLFVVRRDNSGDPRLRETILSVLRRPGVHVCTLYDGVASRTALKAALAGTPADGNPRVHHLGPVSLVVYRNVLRLAGLVVMPGVVPPSSLLEVMSVGAPVVTFLPTLSAACLEDGRNILCCPKDPATRVPALLDDADTLKRLADAGRATVCEHFSSAELLPALASFLLRARDRWKTEGDVGGGSEPKKPAKRRF